MFTINQLIDIFSKEITNYTLPETPSNLYRPIGYTLESGGKRIRPLMVLIAANMFCDSIDKAIAPALAIEIFHNFTLLHDDIMDNADVRRGRATVHKRWNENVAILSGDVMVIKAYEALGSCKTDRFADMFASFNKLASLVCEGQQYDMDFEERDDVTIDEYINMITLKTSALIAGALEIGAICADASDENCKLLYEFGENLGIAFQLQDDLLDTFGNPETFGKRIGGDILEAKKTFLLLSLLKVATEDDIVATNRLFTDSGIDEEAKIESVKALYNKYYIKEMAEKEIDIYFERALDIVEHIEVAAERKVTLLSLAKSLIKRDK